MKNKELKIGLALGSGGFRGLAHIGVLKVLEENDIKISYLSGSSIGGLVAAYYAILKDAKQLEKEVETWPMDSLYKFIDLSWTGGIITGDKFVTFLNKRFGNLNFSKTKIPLKIVATNLLDGQSVILSSGKLTDAIRATISVPLMFRPCKLNDKLLVDGALSSPVPIDQIKEMGADIFIGVNLYHKNEFIEKKFTMPQIVLRSTRIVLYNLAKIDMRQAHVSIKPDTSSIIIDNSLKKYNLTTVKKLIKIGEDSARQALPEIKAFLDKKNK